jgi:O-antigen biosynthesis protein WbqP
MKKKPIYSFFKRLFDIFCSLLAIIVLGLPMIIVSLAIKIDSQGPILFRQTRIGQNKKLFQIWKFRSMYIDTDPNAPTHKLSNANNHITKVGKFIRKTFIDELPQLFNILSGERGIIETTKKNADFSRVVTVNSISL